MRRVVSSWQVIDGVFKEHAHSTYRALRPPVTGRKLSQLEKLVGNKLPHDLASSLLVHDGMRSTTELVNFFTLLPAAQMADWWRVGRDVQKLYEFEGDNVTRTRKIKNDVRWRPGWVPIMADAGGDLIVCDLDPGPTGKRGQIFPWFNNGSQEMRVISDSFRAWLDSLAEELVQRRFSLDDYGTIQLQKQLA